MTEALIAIAALASRAEGKCAAVVDMRSYLLARAAHFDEVVIPFPGSMKLLCRQSCDGRTGKLETVGGGESAPTVRGRR